MKLEHSLVERSRIAHAVDARNAAHHNHILPSRKQSTCGSESHLVNLVVDGQVLLDISVCRRHIGFRLIVVVVADVVLHSIMREELLHLAIKLSGKRLVVGKDEGRAIDIADDICDGKRLAATRYTQQSLCPDALTNAFRELLNRLRLVACGLIIRYEFEQIHDSICKVTKKITIYQII